MGHGDYQLTSWALASKSAWVSVWKSSRLGSRVVYSFVHRHFTKGVIFGAVKG
jgi:hypothetical protein